MAAYRGQVKNWSGYTRRERRSSVVLLIIIAAVIGIRYLFPGRNMEIESTVLLFRDSCYSGNIQEGNSLNEKYRYSSRKVQISGISDRKNNYSGMIRTGGTSDKTRRRAPGRTGSGDSIFPPGKILFQDSVAGRYEKGLQGYKKPAGHKIDINKCDSAALVSLPGIGPVLSSRIIRYRNLIGGYARIEQIREVYGLPEETYNLIRGSLVADSTDIRRIRINTAGYGELIRLHYLEKYDITAVLKYRELHGSIGGIAELVENKILSPEKACKIRPYLDFSR